MSSIYDKYETVIGLEIHAQLQTKTKAYSADKNEYGSTPNTNVSSVSLGHPGTLPVYNKEAMKFAVKMGLACESNITKDMIFARKNYFYPDLPKGYQITQDETPICKGGVIQIKDENGDNKLIELTRIHLEEDAGKSIHDLDPYNTLIDLNRAGVPLIEIVSEPQLKSSTEAYNYVSEVRKLVRYLDVCDGNMEEGSLRCDANVSVMLKGSKVFGNRTEVKNMNSIRNVQRAIEHEVVRQSQLLDNGQSVLQETRLCNDDTGVTTGQRSKEEANDYRYLPCPDLLPLQISEEWIQEIKDSIPKLPAEVLAELQKKFNLKPDNAEIIAESKELSDYFFAVSELTSNFRGISNLLVGPIKSYLNESKISIRDFSLSPRQLAELIQLVDDNKLSFSMASTRVLPELIKTPNKTALHIAEELSLIQDNDESGMTQIVEQVLASMPDKVAAYKKGKKALLGMFMGQVMKQSGGKANPKIATKIIEDLLAK